MAANYISLSWSPESTLSARASSFRLVWLIERSIISQGVKIGASIVRSAKQILTRFRLKCNLPKKKKIQFHHQELQASTWIQKEISSLIRSWKVLMEHPTESRRNCPPGLHRENDSSVFRLISITIVAWSCIVGLETGVHHVVQKWDGIISWAPKVAAEV
jgi:hypothetical protein